mmetsp:Transcript_29780/g.96788  ORF Transcript_29780/g.96788 Transcript_29780/m.96788 type:complete len:292 (+) Transcript_29780:112-987(+)
MRLWTCVVLPFLPLPGLTAARNHIYKQAIKSRLGRQREATSWALGLAAQIPDRSGLSPALSCFLQRTEVHARWAYSPPPLRRRRRCAATAPPSFSLSLSVAAATPPASGVAESPPRASSASAVHALLVRLLLEPARLVLEVDLAPLRREEDVRLLGVLRGAVSPAVDVGPRAVAEELNPALKRRDLALAPLDALPRRRRPRRRGRAWLCRLPCARLWLPRPRRRARRGGPRRARRRRLGRAPCGGGLGRGGAAAVAARRRAPRCARWLRFEAVDRRPRALRPLRSAAAAAA